MCSRTRVIEGIGEFRIGLRDSYESFDRPEQRRILGDLLEVKRVEGL